MLLVLVMVIVTNMRRFVLYTNMYDYCLLFVYVFSAVTGVQWLPVVATQSAETIVGQQCVLCSTADGCVAIVSCHGVILDITHTDSPLRCVGVVSVPSSQWHSTSSDTTAAVSVTNLAVCGCQNGNLVIYSLLSPAPAQQCSAQSTQETSMRLQPYISSDSGSGGGSVGGGRYTLNHVHTLIGAHSSSAVTAMSSAGSALVTGSEDGILRVWNFITTAKPRKPTHV